MDPESASNTIQAASSFLASGGADAIIGILLVIITGLIVERLRILKKISEKDNIILESRENEISSIKKIIDKYHEGNLNLSMTLSEIRQVLQSIQNSRRD